MPTAWGRTHVTLTGAGGQGEPIPLTATPGSAAWPSAFLLPGATGLDFPTIALHSDDSPALDGSIFRGSRAASREIMLPVYLHGIDRPTVNGLKRLFYRSLNPALGPCRIRFTEGSGVSRWIDAYYKGGMEGSESEEQAGFTWARYGLTFTAMDPWYYEDSPVGERWSFGQGEPLVSTTAPFFPLHIAEAALGGDGEDLEISNPGDTHAWPVWQLKGPIKSFSLTGPEGGTISMSTPSSGDAVPSGRTLTIDARPGRKTVRDDRGANYWEKLDTAPHFWSVPPGTTHADISVVTGSSKSSVALTIYPRYASYV